MEGSGKSRWQILVVDDEPTVCRAIQMMLKYDGHRVLTADSAVLALALFEQGGFDIVITDYLMPEMKGDELVARIKQRQPGQPIIMATAFAEDFIINGRPGRGVNYVLQKPFSLEQLRAAVAEVMA